MICIDSSVGIIFVVVANDRLSICPPWLAEGGLITKALGGAPDSWEGGGEWFLLIGMLQHYVGFLISRGSVTLVTRLLTNYETIHKSKNVRRRWSISEYNRILASFGNSTCARGWERNRFTVIRNILLGMRKHRDGVIPKIKQSHLFDIWLPKNTARDPASHLVAMTMASPFTDDECNDRGG